MAGLGQGIVCREAVERGDGLGGADRALDRLKERLLIAGQEAQAIQPLGRETREFQGGAEGLPGLGYARHGREA